MEYPPMDQITKEQAIELYYSDVWKKWTAEQIVRFQLFQRKLCIPQEVFHKALGEVFGREVFGREVWLHELSNKKELMEEYLGTRTAPTFAEIQAMLPANKTISIPKLDDENTNETWSIGSQLVYQGQTGIIKFSDEDGILFEAGNNKEFIPYTQLEGLEPVSTGEIVKLQKPNETSFENTHTDSEGNVVGTCTECGQSNVMVKDHICQTLLNVTEDELGDEYVPSFQEFHEAKLTVWKQFDDTQIARLKKLWNMQHIKYHNDNFFSKIMKQLEDKKKLSEKQFDELNFLLTNGRSKYEAGVLTTKN